MAVELLEIPRTCTKCQQTKAITEFHRFTDKRRGTTGYRWHCKVCASRSACDWSKRNLARAAANKLRRYYARKSDAGFMEKKREQGRQYQSKVWSAPESIAAAKDKYQRSRLRDVVPFLIRAARTRANQRRLPFDLTIEWARSRWTGCCELTGLAFQQCVGSQGPRSPSIDKIDPALGYVQGNCRFVLSSINWFKGSTTDEEMFDIAAALLKRSGRWP